MHAWIMHETRRLRASREIEWQPISVISLGVAGRWADIGMEWTERSGADSRPVGRAAPLFYGRLLLLTRRDETWQFSSPSAAAAAAAETCSLKRRFSFNRLISSHFSVRSSSFCSWDNFSADVDRKHSGTIAPQCPSVPDSVSRSDENVNMRWGLVETKQTTKFRFECTTACRSSFCCSHWFSASSPLW